jgi:hypothetical protein
MRFCERLNLMLPNIGGRAPAGNENERGSGIELSRFDHLQGDTFAYIHHARRSRRRRPARLHRAEADCYTQAKGSESFTPDRHGAFSFNRCPPLRKRQKNQIFGQRRSLSVGLQNRLGAASTRQITGEQPDLLP